MADPQRGPKASYYLFVALTVCLVVSLFLGGSAWRNARNRDKLADGPRSFRETLACLLVAVSMVPFVAMWLFAMVEPYESTRLVDVPVALLWHAAVYLYVPAALSLVGSFWLFTGASLNRPLMAIRLMWLVMTVFVPIVFYYFILPRLG